MSREQYINLEKKLIAQTLFQAPRICAHKEKEREK